MRRGGTVSSVINKNNKKSHNNDTMPPQSHGMCQHTLTPRCTFVIMRLGGAAFGVPQLCITPLCPVEVTIRSCQRTKTNLILCPTIRGTGGRIQRWRVPSTIISAYSRRARGSPAPNRCRPRDICPKRRAKRCSAQQERGFKEHCSTGCVTERGGERVVRWG